MEYREDNEKYEDDAPCADCIHQPMCSGKNCHFDLKWYWDELEKKYYHVNDFGERLSMELYSEKDKAEQFTDWPSDTKGPFFADKREWERTHKKRNFVVRISIETHVEARDDIEARHVACEKWGFKDEATAEINSDTDTTRFAKVDVLKQYRMPVKYLCCEEGYSWGHEYTRAKSLEEAKFLFRDEWIPDIESEPDFESIECYDEEEKEWY